MNRQVKGMQGYLKHFLENEEYKLKNLFQSDINSISDYEMNLIKIDIQNRVNNFYHQNTYSINSIIDSNMLIERYKYFLFLTTAIKCDIILNEVIQHFLEKEGIEYVRVG